MDKHLVAEFSAELRGEANQVTSPQRKTSLLTLADRMDAAVANDTDPSASEVLRAVKTTERVLMERSR